MKNTTSKETRKLSKAFSWTASFMGLFTLVSCGNPQMPGQLNPTTLSSMKSGAIVGEVDWQNMDELNEDGHPSILKNAKAVGKITIPANNNSRCTAFIVSDDLIMTNWHCFPKASSAKGATFYPEFEEGETRVDYLKTKGYECSEFVMSEYLLDVALLRCKEKVGQIYGTVALEHDESKVTTAGEGQRFDGSLLSASSEETPEGEVKENKESVYVIHQNCDYHKGDRSCAPTKKYSPGRVVNPPEELRMRYRGPEVYYDADTLGGSSGSPVFSADTHKVVAIHHNGLGKTYWSQGRGKANSGIPLPHILKYLSLYYSDLFQDQFTDYLDVVSHNSGDVNFLEPNDNLDRATPLPQHLGLKGSLDGENDADIYKIQIKGTLDNSDDENREEEGLLETVSISFNLLGTPEEREAEGQKLKVIVVDKSLNTYLEEKLDGLTSSLNLEKKLKSGEYYVVILPLSEGKSSYHIKLN